MAESLGQAVLEVGVDDTRLRAGLQGVEQQATRSGKEIEKRLGGALDTIRNTLATIGAVAVFRDLIRSATELENITRKLSNTLGDQGTQQVIGNLRQLSDRLGLSFNVLADSFGSFTAAASAANIPLNEQEDLFAAVSTSAQRLGLSNDALSGSLLAIQQIASKGNVQMEELRGQLGERLPIAFGASARGLGVTNAELIKLVESGKLTAEQFFPALTKGLNELNGSGGGSVPTAAQNFALLGNELEKLKAQVGTEFLPGVVEAVQTLAKALGGLNVQIEANKLGFGQGFLGNLFGVVSAEGAQAVGTLQQLANTYGLSQQQARALFTDAVKEVGATTNAFGQLNLTAEQYERVLARLPELAAAFTKQGRASAAAQQESIADARRAFAEDAKRLNTLDKINERLKAARKELGGLDVGSAAAKEKQKEIAELERQGQTAEKAAKAIQKAQEEAAKRSKEVADNYVKAAEAAKGAGQSFAEVVAGSRFASESAQRAARGTLEKRALEAIKSGAVNREAVIREFGLGVDGPGSISIQGGGRAFQQSFTGQVGGLDLRSLTLDQLATLGSQISPLADGAQAVQDSNNALKTAIDELRAETATANGRESNLLITVPIGSQKEVFLP